MKIFWKYITLLILLVVLGCDDEQYYQGSPMTSKMEVSQQGSDGKENGYDYVDLGLPSGLKWATCNVGASKPEEYGEYFAWGETTPKSSYSWSNLKYCLDSSGDKFSKYVSSSSHGTVDSKKTLELSDDAARANWGGRWRMPTSTEIDELLNNCTWVWTTQNGVKGYRVTGTKAGYTDRSIFLPAAGYRSGGNLSTTGSFGIYWSSSLNTSYSRSAYDLYFSSSDHYREYNNRYFGLSVRPVCPSGSYVSVTGVKLNTTSVSLEVGDTTTLTATVSPSNATDKSVTWKSSNTSVATVDSNGKITAKSAGTATITVTTTDGNKTATCTVTVKSKSADGKENGHDYVDLGLPSGLKWATCNVGASKPEEYGSYFAWGETTAKSSYTDSNYGYSSNPLTLPLDKDAASVNWGGSWRMPTSTEIDELLNNCTWTWTTLNGVNGYKVTSKKAGYTDKFIFLPAAGDFIKNNLDYVGSDGHYWSSSISSDSYHADVLYFYSGSHYRRDIFNRYCGLSVRPVCPSGSYVSVTGVKLNTTSMSLEVGDTTTLTATVSPSYATDKSVTWKSNNTSVAIVDSIGKITAKSDGTAVITVTTTDGNFTATCIVTVTSQSADGKENGYDYVDLGLPSGLKWATCNVGAGKPEDYGSYFAWGETTAKSSYDWENLKYHTSGDSYENVKFSKYVSDSNYGTIDNRTTLELSDDAARANWGGSWRMPTDAEFGELINNCTWTWTTQNGVNGYKVTSKKSGYTDKSIFLPAAGFRSNGSLRNAGSNGYYWSSSLDTYYSGLACVLYFDSSSHDRGYSTRFCGRSVRPVCPSGSYVSVTGVKLNTTSMSLEVGDTTTLTATVSPSNATDKRVTWKSSNTTVATVDSYGKVTAKSAGTATITVTTTDGSNTSTCTVTVKSQQVSVTGVKLNTSSVSLEVGGTTTLTATVSPSTATDKSVTWKSSNTTVATVDSIGNVTAKSAGTATITVTTTDGGNTATCTVTVNADGKENGHDYVDLGLPSGIKWATCNVGTSKPENYGSYFAWGETVGDPYIEGKTSGYSKSFDWSTYKYCNGSSTTMTKYCTDSSYGTVDNKTTLELSDDAARANWGGRWRIPTETEINELLNNCAWTWTTQNGVYGYKVTGKKSGYTDKSIFLPAAGYRYNGILNNAGSDGYYWSSSLNSNFSSSAYGLYFYSSGRNRDYYDRFYGHSVRPVCP